MRLILIAALSLGCAGAAQAQYQPIAPIYGPPKPPVTGEGFKPYKPIDPLKPAPHTSVYDDGPFSPAAEARRARAAAKPPAGGPFSPEAAAKRERERDKTFHPY
jgi:hypothetical protein